MGNDPGSKGAVSPNFNKSSRREVTFTNDLEKYKVVEKYTNHNNNHVGFEFGYDNNSNSKYNSKKKLNNNYMQHNPIEEIFNSSEIDILQQSWPKNSDTKNEYFGNSVKLGKGQKLAPIGVGTPGIFEREKKSRPESPLGVMPN